MLIYYSFPQHIFAAQLKRYSLCLHHARIQSDLEHSHSDVTLTETHPGHATATGQWGRDAISGHSETPLVIQR